MAGSYQFTASCKDVLGQTLNFDSNAIPIAYAEPTPVPTEAPLVTPPAPATEPLPTDQPEPEWLDQAEGVAGIAKWILAGVGGLLLLLLLIGAVRRGKSRSDSKKAMDHLEGATYRDYGTKPKHRRSEINNGGTTEDKPAAEDDKPEVKEEVENTVQSSELMAETLRRLYSDKAEETAEAVTEAVEEKAEAAAEAAETAAADAAEAAQEVKSAAEETGGARRRRGRKQE